MKRLAPLLLSLLPLAAPAAAESWHARCAAAAPAAAFKPCEEALIDDPGDLVALKRLGDVSLGNHAEWRAVELYGRRILLDPENPEAWFDQAAALATMWYFVEAAAPLTQALAMDPANPRFLRLASIVYERAGPPEAAFAAHRALAEAGVDTGMYDLAQDLHYGRGTLPDGPAARLWYERAAEAGHVAAMSALAEHLTGGALGQPDPAAATRWRQQAEAILGAYEE